MAEQFNLINTPPMEPSEPLWKRVPTHTEDGRALADFMMLIPGLRSAPKHRLQKTIEEIQAVFHLYGKNVVFADLNLRLNLLWVSLKPCPGICLEVAAALNHRLPQAKLVANRFEVMVSQGKGLGKPR